MADTLGWGDVVKGYLGLGVPGLVAITMLLLYIRKDRECTRITQLMLNKMLEVSEAWRSMVKELDESLRARRIPRRRRNTDQSLHALHTDVEHELPETAELSQNTRF